MSEENTLRRFTIVQLLNFCLGFLGLQFAWQMRIILSGPVTESLGASPFLFGLIWLAGPVTGMVVQPLIGALSDSTYTKFGRRRPYILGGAILASISLWLFPNSAYIVEKIGSLLNINFPVFAGLLFAAIMIWVIDACINAAQGPYRAIIPDTIVPEQHAIANSFLSFAIGLGSVIAAGTAPFLKWAFDYQMSVEAQFIMAAIAFSGATIWTCMTIKENKPVKSEKTNNENDNKKSFKDCLIEFFKASPDVFKVCAMQFFTWIGVMSMLIFFTQYSIHTVFGVPDLTSASEAVKLTWTNKIQEATNFSSICFAVFNLICFIISLPIGIVSSKFGNKKVHSICLSITAITFLLLAYTTNPKIVLILMSIAGIGWASTLALPFAMLSEHIKKGTEGSVMGIFNIFIAGPQVLVCTLLAWFINSSEIVTSQGLNHHWEYCFLVGAVVLIIAAVIANTVNENNSNK